MLELEERRVEKRKDEKRLLVTSEILLETFWNPRCRLEGREHQQNKVK